MKTEIVTTVFLQNSFNLDN